MHTVLMALTPVLMLIATGWAIANYKMISADGWRPMETLCYWLLFPAVLFTSVSDADFASLDLGSYAIGLYGTLALLCVILVPTGVLLRHQLEVSGPAFSSIFQGTTRWNAFIALAIVSNILADEGWTLIAITMALLIPVMNVLSITMMTFYASSNALSIKALVMGIVKNPFIISIGAGLIVNVTGLDLPGFIEDYAEFLGRAALPLAILSVGAAIDMKSLRKPGPRLLIGCLLRLVVAPAIALAVATLLGLGSNATIALVIAFAVPTAAASYVLARQMGGDATLMAELLALQTLASAVTVPLWLLLLV
ncbi:AEC family transporter [Pseudovibrio sp. SPO723]|uniref:AEC family transporter n=1 Tax=Nesiotobacter zosterae TaxID=392721 RepID=UPI0029C15B26|nr:AEC family transporter [Pseudovibrio sp. SPO723]MDX5594457.1 AEC family transporter [Pseudovibrio sp. SPO723]